ncbi:MAG: hypothetical protein HY040_14490 [Planctomycetes bacterium]|nr:hypothetical protein [Planctomycetota bacterium]
MIATQSSSFAAATVKCPIAGIGTLRADADQLVKLRRQPGVRAGKPFSPAFLKHADDQTVAAVAVVAQTIAKQGWDDRSFRDWGVVAAPILFGRFGNEAALRRFVSEGAWGISPHMIPHHSLHAVAGTISQAWQIHGPNFGISGGPGAAAEAFLVAATMVSENNLPGLWLVLTGFDPEYIPEKGAGKPTQPTTCLAAALALTPDNPSAGLPSLRVGCETQHQDDPHSSDFSLRALVNHLECKGNDGHGQWRMPGGVDFDWQIEAETQR